MANENIKQVKIGSDTHEINAKFIQDGSGNAKTWADITALVTAGAELVYLDELPTADATAYATYGGDIVLVPDATSVSGTCEEYVIMRSGTSGSYTYAWEKIGTTAADLVNYLKKSTTYANAAQSNGNHTHTVTVPTISVDATKKLGATASGTAVGADGTATFVKSYPGATSKLVTTTVTGVSGSTTASKATAGTPFNAVKTVSISGESETGTGRVAYVASVTAPTLGGTKTFNTDAIKSASLTGTKTFAVQPTVDANGVLEFTTGTVGISTTAASTGTVSISGGTGTTKYLAASTTTESVTPYTFSNVTVPNAASNATTVATGSLDANGSGATVMTGLGTATTGTALTGVKVTAQPTITITEATTNTGPVNEHTTTSTASATTSETGAHTHNINVTA